MSEIPVRSIGLCRSVGWRCHRRASARGRHTAAIVVISNKASRLLDGGRSVLCTVLDDSETRARVSGLPFGCLILPLSGVWIVEPQLDGWKTGTGARTETTTTTVSARTDPFRGLVFFLFGIFLPKTGSQPGVIHWE